MFFQGEVLVAPTMSPTAKEGKTVDPTVFVIPRKPPLISQYMARVAREEAARQSIEHREADRFDFKLNQTRWIAWYMYMYIGMYI